MKKPCVFCRIIRGETESCRVWEDEMSVAFLDHRPLFAGHCLVAPREHWQSLGDMPPALIVPLFSAVQLLSKAVERGLGADGSFVAINNRVSQSVPHLHVHVVPRTHKDGLRGFFWPRQPYRDDNQMKETQERVQAAIAQILSSGG